MGRYSATISQESVEDIIHRDGKSVNIVHSNGKSVDVANNEGTAAAVVSEQMPSPSSPIVINHNHEDHDKIALLDQKIQHALDAAPDVEKMIADADTTTTATATATANTAKTVPPVTAKTVPPVTAKTVPPVTAKTVPPVPSTTSSDFIVQHQQQHSFDPATIAFGMLGLVFGMLLLVGFCANARRRRRMNKRKQSVYEVLMKFGVEDVRLDKSATGGWHGTYQSDDLVFGENHEYLDEVDLMEGGNTVTNSVDTTLNYPIRYNDNIDIVDDDDDSSDDDGSGGHDNDLFSSVEFGSENTHDII